MAVSIKTTEKIYSYARRDLEPSSWAVVWRLFVSLMIGGSFSLVFCGQFGMGFSEMARQWYQGIHQAIGAIPCAVTCGAIFSVAPAAILRIFSSPILYRKIIRGYPLFQGVFIGMVGLLLYAIGSLSSETITLVAWYASAWGCYKIVGLTIDQGSRFLFVGATD